MITIINGNIAQEYDILKNYALLTEQERIYDTAPQAKLVSMRIDEVYNTYGGYITPGFIDMHSDHIEAMAAPRPNSIMDTELTAYEPEEECCIHNTTTMFHSVSVWEGVGASPMRRPELVRQLTDIIGKSRTRLHLIHHHFHMRFEIDSQKRFPLMLDYLRQKYVHLISFADRTPGQGQYRNTEVYKSYVRNVRSTNEEEIAEEVARCMNGDRLALENMQTTARLAKAQDTSATSHDDDMIKKLDVVQKFGIIISESPITLEVVRGAKRCDMYMVVDTPDVLLDDNHSDNIDVADATARDAVDILCNDYYPASLLHAVFQMTERGQRLEEMVDRVAIHPARATGIDRNYGSVEKGKKADLLTIRILPNEPSVTTRVFVDSMCIAQNHYRVQPC